MKKSDGLLKLIKHYLFCRKKFNVEKYCKNFWVYECKVCGANLYKKIDN